MVLRIILIAVILVCTVDSHACELGGCVVETEFGNFSLSGEPKFDVKRDRWIIQNGSEFFVFNPSDTHVWGPDGEFVVSKIGKVSVIPYEYDRKIVVNSQNEWVNEVDTAKLDVKTNTWYCTIHNLMGDELMVTYNANRYKIISKR